MGLLVGADEVAEELNVSKAEASEIIRQLNTELKEDNYVTISDKIPRKIFEERFSVEVDTMKRKAKKNARFNVDCTITDQGSCRKKMTIRSVEVNIKKEFDEGIVFEYDERIGQKEAEDKLFEFCRNLIEKNIVGWYIGG